MSHLQFIRYIPLRLGGEFGEQFSQFCESVPLRITPNIPVNPSHRFPNTTYLVLRIFLNQELMQQTNQQGIIELIFLYHSDRRERQPSLGWSDLTKSYWNKYGTATARRSARWYHSILKETRGC
jgi:hypothetical protein